MAVEISAAINGERVTRHVPDDQLLCDFLREGLGLLGTRVGCNEGVCGSCTVLVDGQQVRACLMLAAQVDGCDVLTVEGLATGPRRRELHPLQRAFIEYGAVQCGFCTSGLLIASKALLDANPHPTEAAAKPTIVGLSVPRLESEAKVTGQGRYVADLELPRMLHARLVRSPYAHARVARVDASAALAPPGVSCVLSSQDVGRHFPALRSFSTLGEREPGKPEQPGDMRLFDSRVRYAGEPVAGVVAETDALAREAARLVEVEYEPLPAALDVETALAEGAPLVHEEAAGNVAARVTRRRGNVEAALDAATLVLEQRFVTPRQKQAQLEPTGCVAEVDGNGKLTVWSPNHAPHRIRNALASIFGLPQSKVRVVTPLIGGTFGKGDALTAEPYGAALALATGRPIKLRFSRQEDF